MTEEKDVTQESSPELKAALEGSAPPQEVQETQTETAEQAVTQEQVEEERVPYSRFKEVNDEKNWLKQQLEQTLQRQPIQQQPTQDPYAGLTPEERMWRTEEDKRIEQRARQIVQQEVMPLIDLGRKEIARMSVSQFRREYPDVKPNSPEEIEIAQKISQGYILDDAYRVVMWDKKVLQAEKQAKQEVKQQIEAKKQANVESSRSIPTTSNLVKENLTLRQRLEKNWQDIQAGKI